MESIGSIIMEALRTTSSLLGLGTEPSVMDPDDANETCSIFRIEYLDEEKFTDKSVMGMIGTINLLVSLNRSLLRLRWSLEKFMKDYVQASESEEGAERATQIQNAHVAIGDNNGFFLKKTDNCLRQLDEGEFKKRLMSIEGLLFDVEKDMLKNMGRDVILESMCPVALIVPEDEEMLITRVISLNIDDRIFEEAIHAHRRRKIEEFQAKKIDVLLLILFPVLCLLDVLTDCSSAFKHLSQSNYLYFAFTILFILGPMLAEIMANIFQSMRSVMFAINSRRKFDEDCLFYKELNRARGGLSEELSENLRLRFIALSIVMALYPVWFSVAVFFYLGFRFLYLYKYNSGRDAYRWLTMKTKHALWMVYRLFIPPGYLAH